ncbi:uncharacterized protein [Lepeophtheirus salmonis]|uniref:uncharacterized protein n=1 Tax=Lepeophtheirus salmonis TaxID=72036 RepID=UPI001AE628A0|nr:uncharacterized oxidoreductase dhs-27-like [Lepeophtheirus salmonis]
MEDIVKKAIANELALTNSEKIDICQIKSSAGSTSLDNFLSQLDAVEVKVRIPGESRESFHYVVKGMSKENEEFIKKLLVFEKEVNIYKTFLPLLQKMGDKVGLRAPKCYYSSKSVPVVVMEDLKMKGYSMMSPKFGMKETHIKWALDQFGRLHAYSHALMTNNSDKEQELTEILRMKEDLDLSAVLALHESIYKGQVKALEHGGRKDLAERFEAVIPQAEYVIRSAFKNFDSNFCVINHGDGWTNNFMFKHDKEGNLEDGVILDWQFPFYSSPVKDLAIFFGFSISPKERKEHTKSYLRFYYDRLSFHMDVLGLDVSQLYPFESMIQEYEDKYPILYFLTAQMLPIFYMKSSIPEDDKVPIDISSEQCTSMWEELILKIAKKDPYFFNVLIEFHEEAATKGFI